MCPVQSSCIGSFLAFESNLPFTVNEILEELLSPPYISVSKSVKQGGVITCLMSSLWVLNEKSLKILSLSHD